MTAHVVATETDEATRPPRLEEARPRTYLPARDAEAPPAVPRSQP